MDFMVTGRRAGKTDKILYEATQYRNSVIVCPDEKQAVDLRKRLEEMFPYAEDNRPKVISAQSHQRFLGLRGPVFLDNADAILRLLFGDVRFVTATGEIDGR